MRLELAQTFAVGSDATNGRKPPVCVRQDKTVPTLRLFCTLVGAIHELPLPKVRTIVNLHIVKSLFLS